MLFIVPGGFSDLINQDLNWNLETCKKKNELPVALKVQQDPQCP